MTHVIRQKRHRLAAEAYVGEITVAFTACVRDRGRLFVDSSVFDAHLIMLGRWADRYDCAVPMFCFMPDHLHVMLMGLSGRAEPKRAMDSFKLESGIWISKNRPAFHWQRGYYDHVVRRSHDWRRQAAYIFSNPVRAGLVVDPFDYPYSGCIGCPIEEVAGYL